MHQTEKWVCLLSLLDLAYPESMYQNESAQSCPQPELPQVETRCSKATLKCVLKQNYVEVCCAARDVACSKAVFGCAVKQDYPENVLGSKAMLRYAEQQGHVEMKQGYAETPSALSRASLSRNCSTTGKHRGCACDFGLGFRW